MKRAWLVPGELKSRIRMELFQSFLFSEEPHVYSCQDKTHSQGQESHKVDDAKQECDNLAQEQQKHGYDKRSAEYADGIAQVAEVLMDFAFLHWPTLT